MYSICKCMYVIMYIIIMHLIMYAHAYICAIETIYCRNINVLIHLFIYTFIMAAVIVQMQEQIKLKEL